MEEYEKLGSFYLGRVYDLDAQKAKDDLLLYDSKDLTTHAVCVGMTGSGKTGLCMALIEEAAIDGVPAILIDPKGDLANLLLTFPELKVGRISSRGSTSTRRDKKDCRQRITPTNRRTPGRTDCQVGTKAGSASNVYAMQQIFAFTLPAAARESLFRS